MGKETKKLPFPGIFWKIFSAKKTVDLRQQHILCKSNKVSKIKPLTMALQRGYPLAWDLDLPPKDLEVNMVPCLTKGNLHVKFKRLDENRGLYSAHKQGTHTCTH